MSEFQNVTVVKPANVYFDGKVVSLTVGITLPTPRLDLPSIRHDSSSSKSSRVRLCSTLLSAVMMASARSRLDFCSSRSFSSTVSRAIKR